MQCSAVQCRGLGQCSPVQSSTLYIAAHATRLHQYLLLSLSRPLPLSLSLSLSALGGGGVGVVTVGVDEDSIS